MFTADKNDDLVKNTTYKVVLPFYAYAAISFLFATILLFFSASAFTKHYFHPNTLAITHCMALGWGTMMILGASHQLVPVLIEGKLYSNVLAYISFVFGAIGIPLLIYGFYFFNLGWPAQSGGILINAAVITYLLNLAVSMVKSKKENVHAVFIFTASLWLLLTTLLGLLLLYNFTAIILPKDSLHYLSLHAHIGIIGWFLLLVMGVGSRLIPMFLISKYNNTKLLWVIYGLVNGSLLSFILSFLFLNTTAFYFIPVTAMLLVLLLFGYYCYSCYKQRIRKKVDEQMKITLTSVMMLLIPLIFLIIIIASLLLGTVNTKMVLLYGFVIFFGWITAIIFGMTFKTLPFIIWNKVYRLHAGLGKTPNPKDLFSSKIFIAMCFIYLFGFALFISGIYFTKIIILQAAAALLIVTALLYNWNVFKMFFHKSSKV